MNSLAAADPLGFSAQIRDSLTRTMLGMWDQAVALIPRVAGMLIILLIGYVVAIVIKWLCTSILRRIRFDVACEKTGLTQTLRTIGLQLTATEVVGRLAFWALILMFLVSAVDVLGMQTVSSSINSLVGYLPNVVGALVLAAVGLMLANFVRDLVHGSAERLGFEYGSAASQLVYALLLILIGSLAVGQLQINTDLIDRAIEIVLMATGAALAIALGFGTRETARHVVAGVYARESFPVGTALRFKDESGVVEAVCAVNTKIKTDSGETVYVPNAQLLETVVRETV